MLLLEKGIFETRDGKGQKGGTFNNFGRCIQNFPKFVVFNRTKEGRIMRQR